MFIGEFRHTLDDKGRLAIPAKFRVALKSDAVVTRGLDQTLCVYPKETWEKLANKIAALPMGQADTRAFARLVLAGASEVEIDSSGRISIPEYLRQYAGISKDVVIAGLYDRLEIWDAAMWDAYARSAEEQSGPIAERLGLLI